jgi:hypothetical protein
MSTAAAAGPVPEAAAVPEAVAVPPAQTSGVPAASARCDNCGAAVAERYCPACGQRLEPPLHSVWHFAQAATEDLTHADSRLWRTLGALLFRPGRLTAEFLAGRRVRYLPPVRLYLVLSVVFFLWASATNLTPYVVEIHTQTGSARVVPLGEVQDAPFKPAVPGESATQRADRECGELVYRGPWQRQLSPLLQRACRRAVEDNGRSLREAMLHNVPRAMFVFLPLLAAGMMLLYWRPRHYYIEHLLLLVHYHAFVFLALLLAGAAAALLPVGSGWIRLALLLYIPWYLYRSMRVVYRQNAWLTAGKLLLLSMFYLVSGLLMLVVTSVYSAVTLA